MRRGGAIIILGLILGTAVHAQSSHEPNPIVLPQGPHMENPTDSSHVYVRPNDPDASHPSWSFPAAGTTPEYVFLLGVILLGVVVLRSSLFLSFEVYRLCALIREQRPQEWEAHGGYASATRWIASLVLGRAKLDIPGKGYARRLSYVRGTLWLTPIFLLVSLGLIAWAVAQ